MHAGHPHWNLLEVLGPVRRGDEHDHRAIRHQAAIQQMQRVGNHTRGLVLRHVHRRPHHGLGVHAGVLAEGDGDRGQLLGCGAVHVHVALHRNGGAAGRRGQPVGGRLAMGAAFLPHAFHIGLAAHRLPAGEADGGDAGDHVGQPGLHRQGGMLHRHRHEPAMRPGLVHVADLQPQPPRRHGHSRARLAIRDEWTSRRYRPVQARVIERRLECVRAEGKRTPASPPTELAGTDADDAGLPRRVTRHGTPRVGPFRNPRHSPQAPPTSAVISRSCWWRYRAGSGPLRCSGGP